MKKLALFSISCAALFGQWNTAYWYSGAEPVSAIPWSMYTHVIHDVAQVNSDGTFDTSELSPYASAIVSAGHAAGKKVLWGLIDGDTGNMGGATSPANINTFVSNIINFTNQYGYDGVDLDWEASLSPSTVPQYENLISLLRSGMPNNVITMFAYDSSELIAVATNQQSTLNQINVGCYGMWGQALPYFFYDDAIYGNTPLGNFGGCANRMNNMANGGVAKGKMGVGMPFFGFRFTGCTLAMQTTCTTNPGYFTYRDLVTDPTRWQPQYEFYDSTYKSNYLSIPSLNEFDPFSGIQFMSDVTTWGNAQGYGGYMVFTQDNEYLSTQSGNAAYPLSTALYNGIYGTGGAPTITTSSLPSGTTGAVYAATLTATGAPSIAWSLPAGSLPPGLSLSTAGVISGTPTTAGTFSFTVQATNTMNGLYSTEALSITISLSGVAPTITTSSLASGTVGSPYSQTLAATGTTPITWGPASLSLPAGLTWNPSAATISGTPTAAGAGTYTFTATNSWGTATKALTLSINPPTTGPFGYWKLDDGSGSTAADSSGYGHTATLFDGPAWESSRNCIAGSCLSFNGTNQYGSVALDLSTTPAVTIAFWMNWTSYANDDRLAFEFSSNFNDVTTGFMVDPNSSNGSGGQFEAGVHGDAGYNQVLFARPTPGWHHYAFIFNKSAPAASEVIPYVDGTAVTYTKPTTSANTNNFAADTFYWMSRGGSSLFGNGVLDEIQIYTQALSGAQIYAIAASYEPTITTTSLPSGVLGHPYSQTLTANGSKPITWSISSGALPQGLSLNSTTGAITGTPIGAGAMNGTSSFTVRASNTAGTVSAALSITVRR